LKSFITKPADGLVRASIAVLPAAVAPMVNTKPSAPGEAPREDESASDAVKE